jgi:hypothetical protein
MAKVKQQNWSTVSMRWATFSIDISKNLIHVTNTAIQTAWQNVDKSHVYLYTAYHN